MAAMSSPFSAVSRIHHRTAQPILRHEDADPQINVVKSTKAQLCSAPGFRPAGPQPPRAEGYGATIWLFGPKQDLPEGSYSAQGSRGQYIMVVPSQQLVVVRRAEDPFTERFDIARFTADVAKAVR